MTSSKCSDVLIKGYPVVIGLEDLDYGGHIALIDYHRINIVSSKNFYVYKKISNPDEDDNPDFPINPTLEELEQIYGVGNVRIEPCTYNSSMYKINWGLDDGIYDDIAINAASSAWSPSRFYKFIPRKMIYFK